MFRLLAVILLVGYVAYPYWSLYRLGEALEIGDEAALKRYVDWRSVRAGLKEDFSGMLSREAGRAIAEGDREALVGGAIASALGSALIEPVIDLVVTPEGLAALIREGRMKRDDPGTGYGGHPDRREGILDHLSFAFFTGPATFEAEFEAESGKEIVAVMQLNGVRWQLVRLHLPEPAGRPAG